MMHMKMFFVLFVVDVDILMSYYLPLFIFILFIIYFLMFFIFLNYYLLFRYLFNLA